MPKALYKIDWNEFRVKQDNPTKAFEDLCYHLFCRKFRLSEGVRVNYNHKGLETDPIKNKEGKLTGFQSKFFENKLSDPSSVSQINHSISAAKTAYYGLEIIIIFTQYSFGSDEPAYKKEIEDKASPIHIEWFTDSNFRAVLFKPANLDLSQLYFGKGSEFLFVKDQLSTELRTFLPSANYIALALKSRDGKDVKNFRKLLTDEPTRTFMIIGNPGSGKSIYLNKLLFDLSGLQYATADKMYLSLLHTGAIPMLINLRNCISESIENLIRQRQNDNQIRGKSFKFIYLFDGLDELNESKADEVLSFLRELEHKSDTFKLVFSCRSGNANRLKVKIFFPDLKEIEIGELSKGQIDTYFHAKSDIQKTHKLAELRINNKFLIQNIHDILLLKLLWDTIETLDGSSTLVDLLDQKMRLLIYSPEHKKQIEDLNLLNPKGEKIMLLHEEIAFQFQKKFQFRFSISELQSLILHMFNLPDFRSVNHLVNYLSDLFFENSYSEYTSNQTYIYQHRRYQEYFFIKKLRKEYEKEAKVLRQLMVISNKEFFENFFMPFLRSAYLKERNLIGNMELNLMEVYQGKNSHFGADNPIYLESERFIYAITGQAPITFEQLINDDNLAIKSKLFQDLPSSNEIKQLFTSLKRNLDDFDTEQRLHNIWEIGVKKLITFCAILHQQGKLQEALEIRVWVAEVRTVYQKHNFIIPSKFKNKIQLHDPFFSSWESWLYIAIVIDNTAVAQIFRDRIRGNYHHFDDHPSFPGNEESGKDKLVKSFLRVCIKYRLRDLINLAGGFDNFETLSFIRILSQAEYLPYLFDHADIKELVNKFIANLKANDSGYDLSFLFIKKILGYDITVEEISKAETDFKQLREREEFSLKHGGKLHDFVLLSYVLEKYDFDLFLDRGDRLESFNYYYDLGLYAAVFKSYVEVLKGARTLQETVRDYNKYNETFTKNNKNKPFRKEMSTLLAHLFGFSNIPVSEKKLLKNLIVFGPDTVNGLSFYTHFKAIAPATVINLITDTELQAFEKGLDLGDNGYYTFIDQCFDLAYLYGGINDAKAVEFIVKGINEGILRHGWRKDVVVSHNLVEALEVLFRNGWESKKQLKKRAKEVFAMTMKVKKITDGKGTWRGPFRMVDMVAQYDLDLAEKFSETIKNETYNYDLSLNTSIAIGQIRLGYPVEALEKQIQKYSKRFLSNGKPRKEYYLERFKVYLAIADSGLYTKEERHTAFSKARKEVAESIEEADIASWDNDLRDEIPVYERLCKHYQEAFDIPLEQNQDKTPRVYDVGEEERFVQDLRAATTKDELQELYKTVFTAADSLRELKSWELVVDKTYEIDGNVSRLIEVLKKNNYPHSDFYAYSNAYYHLALAAALKNLNSKTEMMNYLFYHTGYDGFVNLMKTFEALRDQEMCLLIYNRFYGFCDLLVN